MIYRQPVFQNCHQLNSWTPVRFTKMEFWTRTPSCVYFCVADKDVKSWPSSNPLSLRVVAGWNAEQTEEDESTVVFQHICSSPHRPWYLMSDIIFYIHAISYIWYYDNPFTTRHRKMCHWSFSNTIIPRLAGYLAPLDLMCVSGEEKGGRRDNNQTWLG